MINRIKWELITIKKNNNGILITINFKILLIIIKIIKWFQKINPIKKSKIYNKIKTRDSVGIKKIINLILFWKRKKNNLLILMKIKILTFGILNGISNSMVLYKIIIGILIFGIKAGLIKI